MRYIIDQLSIEDHNHTFYSRFCHLQNVIFSFDSSEYKDYEEYEEEPQSYYLDESVSQEEHVLNQDGYGANYVYGDSRISVSLSTSLNY